MPDRLYCAAAKQGNFSLTKETSAKRFFRLADFCGIADRKTRRPIVRNVLRKAAKAFPHSRKAQDISDGYQGDFALAECGHNLEPRHEP